MADRASVATLQGSKALRGVENEINSHHGGAFANFPGGKSRYAAFCLRRASVPSIFLRCQLNKPASELARSFVCALDRFLAGGGIAPLARSPSRCPRPPPELKLKVKLTFAPQNNNGLSVLRWEDGRGEARERNSTAVASSSPVRLSPAPRGRSDSSSK